MLHKRNGQAQVCGHLTQSNAHILALVHCYLLWDVLNGPGLFDPGYPFLTLRIRRWSISLQVITGSQCYADPQGDQPGEEPGTKMKGDRGKNRWKYIANWIQPNRQRKPNHRDD